MGNTDSIPIVSQAKSGIQLACRDRDAALKTQINFLKGCPGVSQITSLVQLAKGDADEALQIQKDFGKSLGNAVNMIPVVGLVKSLGHLACGDEEGATKAFKTANRRFAVIVGGGIGGTVVGGPIAAVLIGIAVGVAIDGTITVVESEIRGIYTPSGYIAAVENIAKKPTPGEVFDAAMLPVFDGVASV